MFKSSLSNSSTPVRRAFLAAALVVTTIASSLSAVATASADEFFTYTTDSSNNVTVTGCVNLNVCASDLVIPSTLGGNPVTALAEAVFRYKPVTSVTLPSTLTTIGRYAFGDCSLTSITLPSSLKTINGGAFYGNKLTSLVIPNSVTTVGNSAFSRNEIASLTLSQSLTTINDSAFQYNKLTSLVIPSSVTYLGFGAFASNQLTSVTIPNSVTGTGMYVFQDNKLTSVTLSNAMTRIADAAFSGNLLTSVTIPNSVTSIADGAFSNNKLTSVTLPSSLTGIGYGSFTGNLLTSLVIPASVQEISWYTFSKNLLTSVKFEGNYPSSGGYVFDENPGLIAVDVNSGSTGWGDTYAGIPIQDVGGPVIKRASAPKIVSIKSGNGRVTLGIWAPRRYDRTGITGYEYTLNDGAVWNAVDSASAGRSLVIAGLDNGTSYTVKVRARSSRVRGLASKARVVMPRAVASAPVITALTAQDGSIKVEFEAPTNNGGSTITRYAYSVNGKEWHNWGASTSPQVIKALHNRVVCSIRVRALNAAGWGAASDAVEATPHR